MRYEPERIGYAMDIFGSIKKASKKDPVSNVHMIGINGISMSGLAELLLDMGYFVSGSDLSQSERTKKLEEMGATIYKGHAGENLQDPDVVVFTSAVRGGNPELERAHKMGVPCIERAKLLGLIMSRYKKPIAVCGTHGKTTSTAMVTEVLTTAGFDPTAHIGAEYKFIGGTTRIGGSEFFIAEACEYCESFLQLFPHIALISNVELDHIDYFKDIQHFKESFESFARQVQESGFVIANGDDPNCVDIFKGLTPDEQKKWVFFGMKEESRSLCGVYAENIEFDSSCYGMFDAVIRNNPHAEQGISIGAGSSSAQTTDMRCGSDGRQDADMRCGSDGRQDADERCGLDGGQNDDMRCSSDGGQNTDMRYGLDGGQDTSIRIRLSTPGMHNVYNALAAISACHMAGCPTNYICSGLLSFRGADKRFEYKGTVNGMKIVDDYAHHPSEVVYAIETGKKLVGGSRLFCVFQPHTYTRTRHFINEFADALMPADTIILADIYAAREPDPGDISSKTLADAINNNGGNAVYIKEGFEEIAKYLLDNGKPGDLVITMGAGEAVKVADILLQPETASG